MEVFRGVVSQAAQIRPFQLGENVEGDECREALGYDSIETITLSFRLKMACVLA